MQSPPLPLPKEIKIYFFNLGLPAALAYHRSIPPRSFADLRLKLSQSGCINSTKTKRRPTKRQIIRSTWQCSVATMRFSQTQLVNPLTSPKIPLYNIVNFIFYFRAARSLILQPLARNLIPRREIWAETHKRCPGYTVGPRIRAFRSFHEAETLASVVSVTPERSMLRSGYRNTPEAPRRSEARVNEGY